MKIAIQGQAGSFHHLVGEKIFGDTANEFIFCKSFSLVFKALEANQADRAIVACENSLYGSISEVYDLLLDYHYPIIGERVEHIHQQLISWDKMNLGDIKEIYSHPVALNQCRNYLETTFPRAELIEHDDTASAVSNIKEKLLRHAAAIASTTAAKIYDMAILAADIEDEKTNLTRFIVLDPRHNKLVDSPKRALLVLTTPNSPGALYRALGIFNQHSINLTKLESRPIRGESFHYQFFIDADIDGTTISKAITELQANENKIEVLGIF